MVKDKTGLLNRPARDSELPFCNYRMSERASHIDFGIRSQDTALPNLNPHRHEYLQIHVQLEGETQHFLEGRCRPVVPGTVCFILPFKTHFIPTIPNSRYYILNASLGYLLPSLDLNVFDLEDIPPERAPELMPFRFQEKIDFVLDAATLAETRVLCESILREDLLRSIGSTIMIRAYLLQLIALVWRQHGQALVQHTSSQPAGAARRQALVKLFAFLRDNTDEPVSLSDAAAAAHLSPTYLAHLIKRETGKTFTELLTERRITRAKELLLHSNFTVKEIAFRAGFSDVAYFSRRFKQFEGCSPGAIRNKFRATPYAV